MIFASYYYRALDWSVATNDAYLLQGLGTSTCQSCQAFINQINAMNAAGKHMRGGRGTILGLEIVSGKADIAADVLIQVRLRQAKGSVVDADGNVTSTHAASTPTVILLAKWVSAAWRVAEISNS